MNPAHSYLHHLNVDTETYPERAKSSSRFLKLLAPSNHAYIYKRSPTTRLYVQHPCRLQHRFKAMSDPMLFSSRLSHENDSLQITPRDDDTKGEWNTGLLELPTVNVQFLPSDAQLRRRRSTNIYNRLWNTQGISSSLTNDTRLKVNADKTKHMTTSKHKHKNTQPKTQNKEYHEGSEYKYLASVATHDNASGKDVRPRITAGNRYYQGISNIMKPRYTSQDTELKTHTYCSG
jgi:hypothetical protein